MGIFKQLQELFTGARKQASDAYWITVRCSHCGEHIQARVNLFNDLSAEYGRAGGDEVTYFCRKQIIGEGKGESRCFQRIDVELTFNNRYQLIQREISGGAFVDEKEEGRG